MSDPRNIWVVRNGDDWGVRQEGSSHVQSFDRQQDAIDQGRTLAQMMGGELYIQGRDGQIRERNTYRQDPFPPRG
jgi:hypothetical protein